MDAEEKRKKVAIAGSVGAEIEIVQRYGAAAKEHVVAYTGIDNENQVQLTKGLKGIAKSKVNPEYYDMNIKQQAGFSAEIKTVARENADKIIKGNSNAKATRTDDMMRQSDGSGHTVGGTNEQLYDLAEIDANGIYIEGTARQLKFVGGNSEKCTKKLLTKNFDKYRDADVPIEVPSDFYGDVKSELFVRSDRLKKQITDAEKNGNFELVEKHKNHLEKVDKTRELLRKGEVSNKEAIEARLHPKLSTAKDMAKISHRAGIHAAKMGAAIGGGMSFIYNSVAVIKGDKSAGEAVISVMGDTATTAATSYVTNFTSVQLTALMENAPSKYLQTLSKTNLPATVVVAALGVGKTLVRYGSGEISGTECMIELGENGTGMLGSATGAAIGQIVIPIPIVGGLIGSMAGYAMASAYYNGLINVVKETQFAHEERLRVEEECKAAIMAIREYRMEIELVIRNFLTEHIAVFESAFVTMEEAYNTGNVNQFVFGANKITEQLGGIPIFKNKAEFDEKMSSSEAIII